jgi:hypothetical protein
VAAEEYRITSSSGVFHAANRAQNLRSYFDGTGWKLTRRTCGNGALDQGPQQDCEPEWTLLLSTVEIDGVPLAEVSPDVGSCADTSNVGVLGECLPRLEYHRGAAIEFYTNEPRGIEQGYELLYDASPDIDIRIKISYDGLGLRALDDGLLVFSDDEKDRVYYGKLYAVDATGAFLPSALSFDEKYIYITVHDSFAVYPVTIDPLAVTPGWQVEGNQEGAALGTALAGAGDVNNDSFDDVLVSAPRFDTGYQDAGKVFLFLGSSSGLSTTAAWTKIGSEASALYGQSVAGVGDLNHDYMADVLIGAPGATNGTPAHEGLAYVYYGTSTGLSSTAAWVGEGGQGLSEFGFSVAAAGDVDGNGYLDIVIGAPSYDYVSRVTVYDCGKVVVYGWSSSGVPTSAMWSKYGENSNDAFGYSVSGNGNVNGDSYADIAIGAPIFQSQGSSKGKAYIYKGSSSGPVATPSWTVTGTGSGEELGYSIAVDGNYNGDTYSDVIVGSPTYDNGTTDEGRVRVFAGASQFPAANPTWSFEPNEACLAGESVAFGGDVNGDGFDEVMAGGTGCSKAWVFKGGQSGLGATADWSFSAGANSSTGIVAKAGDIDADGFDDVLVGASGLMNGEAGEGRAYLFRGSGVGLSAEPDWQAEANQDYAYLGASVSGAGDVNNDGYDDIVVGAPKYDHSPYSDAGAAFLFLGSQTGLASQASWAYYGGYSGATFADSVSGAGNVNGDSYDDVIIGQYLYTGTNQYEGRAYVFHGNASGLSSTPNWTHSPGRTEELFGWSVSRAGDVNGDGKDDVIIGSRGYSNGQSYEGRVTAFYGSANGLQQTPNWSYESNSALMYLGHSVANVGRLNGDAYDDVAVTGYYWDGAYYRGRALVFCGGSGGLASSPCWQWTGPAYANEGIELKAVSAGNVNGDQYDDLILGTPQHYRYWGADGMVRLFLGSSTGPSSTPDWSVSESDAEDAHFGVGLAGVGDVNGDGFGDVVVGADYHDWMYTYTGHGRVYLYLGSSSGLPGAYDGVFECDQQTAGFGKDVSAAGHVDGDDLADFVVGAPTYSNGQTQEGRAFSFYGTDW